MDGMLIFYVKRLFAEWNIKIATKFLDYLVFSANRLKFVSFSTFPVSLKPGNARNYSMFLEFALVKHNFLGREKGGVRVYTIIVANFGNIVNKRR